MQKNIFSGKVQKVGYRKWIKKEALKQHLHGFVKNLKNGKVMIVVAGKNEEQVKKFRDLCNTGSKKAKVEDVKRRCWEKPIKAGFEII